MGHSSFIICFLSRKSNCLRNDTDFGRILEFGGKTGNKPLYDAVLKSGINYRM